MNKRSANTRESSQGCPKHQEGPPPRPKQGEPIPPETAEGMGLPLTEDERGKQAEALRRSLGRQGSSSF